MKKALFLCKTNTIIVDHSQAHALFSSCCTGKPVAPGSFLCHQDKGMTKGYLKPRKSFAKIRQFVSE